MKFTAFERNLQGTGASRRLRNAGKVPGIVYGAGTPATIDPAPQNSDKQRRAEISKIQRDIAKRRRRRMATSDAASATIAQPSGSQLPKRLNRVGAAAGGPGFPGLHLAGLARGPAAAARQRKHGRAGLRHDDQ